MQAAQRICSELDILRIQGIKSMIEGIFARYLISMTNLIQDFGVRVENLRVVMRGIANNGVPPIRVRATLTLAWHAIGWSGKNLDIQIRETKAN